MSKPMTSQRQKLSFLRSISDSTRLGIISTLLKSRRPTSVTDIADTLGMTHSAVSHQLMKMRAAHVVKCKKDGKNMLYSVNEKRARALHVVMAALDHLDAKALPVRSIEGV